MARLALCLNGRCLQLRHRIPTWWREMGVRRPGDGAETSSAVAMNISTFSRTKQWIGFNTLRSADVAMGRWVRGDLSACIDAGSWCNAAVVTSRLTLVGVLSLCNSREVQEGALLLL